jgi:putative membrane protein
MNSPRVLSAVCSLATAALLCGASAAIAQNTTSPSVSDKKFVQEALQGGAAEVELGQLAVQKASSEDVKQFGQKMMDDHTKMGDQMKDVAKKEGISIPNGVPAKDKELETKLKSLSGESFDNAYIKAMLKDHQHDLSEFKKEANSGNDTSIKDAASQGQQIISEHLKMVQDIAKTHNISTGAQSMNAGTPKGHRESER